MLTFGTKFCHFRGENKRIVCQNANGPCPLLAIFNALILRGQLRLPPGDVDSSKLQHALVGWIVDRYGEQQDTNLRHQIAETIELVMKGRFIEGLDVNVQFRGPDAFEYTQELAVFDLCAVRLLHGWCVESNGDRALERLLNLSYNDATLAIVGNLHEHTSLVRSLTGSLSMTARRHLQKARCADICN
jgi:ubiquitin carboxyl-terminal hydrolase MINDY-1/2